MKKAIILLSGGLDSTVILAMALDSGTQCYALSFDYGQRHRIELEAAKKIADYYHVPHSLIKIDAQAFGQSSLVADSPVPKNRTLTEMSKFTASTYVPARNTLFLAYAAGQAEMLEADEIHYGATSTDYCSYPDCRPKYVEAFQQVLNVATKKAIEQSPPILIAPLISWSKPEIVKKGIELKVPLDLTFSCYDPREGKYPCHECDACTLRELGFSASTCS